ncbi:hypothetical protein AB0O08_12000 [Streptomyces anulatus]|uniref:hypothetical protein n=1 Tax=Streptomyces anulatus TaxID=1892 RepID=UPI00344133AD
MNAGPGPLRVETLDGAVWVQAAVTRAGLGLYCPEGVVSCPRFVMATLAELAEHGVKAAPPVTDLSDAVALMGALPMPVGTAAESDPLIVSRFDTAIEPAPEEDPVLIVGAVSDDGRPVALLLDLEARSKVARWLAPELESARLASPWERAVAGLNALVDSNVAFWVEPDGHISGPFGDEHIEWDQKSSRWVLTHDDATPSGGAST